MATHESYEGETVRRGTYTPPPTDDHEPIREPGMPPVAPRRSKGRGIGQLLLLIGVILLALNLVAGRGWLPVTGGFNRATATISEAFSARELVMEVDNGNVTLQPGSSDTISVEATLHGFGWNRDAAAQAAERVRPTFSQNGDTLRVTQRAGPSMVFFGRSPYAEYRISVPNDADIKISTGSGEIDATSLAGPIDLDTGSGDISLRQISGAVAISVGSGDIAIRDSSAPTIKLNTGSGDVELDGVAGAIEARTGSGSITIEDAEQIGLNVRTSSGNIEFEGSLANADSHRAETGSGSITLRLPDDSSLRIDAETGSGDIRSDWDLDGRGDRRSGTIGGGDARLTLSTGSGDITIERD